MQAAEAADVGCLIYRPKDIYRENEVGKRNEGLRIAGSLLEPDVDWLLIVDADFHILRCEPDAIRAELQATEHDVASYVILDGQDMLANEAMARFARDMDASTEWTHRTRDIYRWNPSLRVGPTHYAYSVQEMRNLAWEPDQRRWLRGPEGELNCEKEPALDLDAKLVFYHRRQDRAAVRRSAAKEYYDRRVRMGVG